MEGTTDRTGFHQHLKKSGKKPHVVDALVAEVAAFETYLTDRCRIDLDSASERDIRDYVDTLPAAEVKERMRGLALYYRFAGNVALVRLASDIREQRIAKSRPAFKLREFRGVSPEDIVKLEAIGIVTVEDMLAAGATCDARQRLADRTGVPLKTILELVQLSDLSRLGGVKSVRARLYYDAGLQTPAKLAQWEPEPLREMLVEFVARSGFDGIAPLPKELRSTVAAARQLPEVVQY